MFGCSKVLSTPPSGGSETEFIKYSLDGKEVSIVNVSFDDPCHLLWVKSEGQSVLSLDLLQLKVMVTIFICIR